VALARVVIFEGVNKQRETPGRRTSVTKYDVATRMTA